MQGSTCKEQLTLIVFLVSYMLDIFQEQKQNMRK